MSGVHAHALHYHSHSVVHGLAPHVKIVALFVFVGAAVTTPAPAVWSFGVLAAVLATAVGLAELPVGFFLRRLAIETPFVILALAMPLVGMGPYLEVAGLELSVPGLWGAWNVVAKATLSVGASVVLAATTEVSEILAGFDRLRAPRILTAIAGFMVRYLEVIVAEIGRVRTAVAARLGDRTRLGEARTLASVSGTMFVRSYERGERVHQAMVARGYTGEMPEGLGDPAEARWSWALMWMGVAWAAALAGLWST